MKAANTNWKAVHTDSRVVNTDRRAEMQTGGRQYRQEGGNTDRREAIQYKTAGCRRQKGCWRQTDRPQVTGSTGGYFLVVI
jgi:hypothetical protein